MSLYMRLSSSYFGIEMPRKTRLGRDQGLSGQ